MSEREDLFGNLYGSRVTRSCLSGSIQASKPSGSHERLRRLVVFPRFELQDVCASSLFVFGDLLVFNFGDFRFFDFR
jgi:hypothetical protein